MLQCRHCGAAAPLDEPMPRDAECPGCGRDLRACVQCRHYDTAYNNACRETMADPVPEKERRNFCEYFSFSREPFRVSATGKQEEARERLEGLFGGTSRPSASQDARARLESLFGGEPKKPEGDPRRRLEDLFRKDPSES